MKFEELKKHLSVEHHPCYLLSGDDKFVIDSAVKVFTSLCGLPEMNVNILSNPAAGDIVMTASMFPVMDDLRVVIAYDFVDDITALKKYLSNPSPQSVIVIVSPTVTKNLSGISNQMTIVDCSRQSDSILIRYIARECQLGGTKITEEAAKLLIESCNRFMTRISVELNKLIAYARDSIIDSSVVERLVNAEPEYKVYELGDSIASRNGEKAMRILDGMLKSGAAGAFGMIYSHFRKLLYVALTLDEDEAKRLLALSDIPYKKLKAQAKLFTQMRLKVICDTLHKVDYDYKSGFISDKMAVSTFVMSVVAEGK